MNKKDLEKANKNKRTLYFITTLIFGISASIYSFNEETTFIGSCMVGLFTCLIIGTPLLFLYTFSKKR